MASSRFAGPSIRGLRPPTPFARSSTRTSKERTKNKKRTNKERNANTGSRAGATQGSSSAYADALLRLRPTCLPAFRRTHAAARRTNQLLIPLPAPTQENTMKDPLDPSTTDIPADKPKKQQTVLNERDRNHIMIALQTQKEVYERQINKAKTADIKRVYEKLSDEITNIQRALR